MIEDQMKTGKIFLTQNLTSVQSPVLGAKHLWSGQPLLFIDQYFFYLIEKRLRMKTHNFHPIKRRNLQSSGSTYIYFEFNRGPLTNFRKLLTNSRNFKSVRILGIDASYRSDGIHACFLIECIPQNCYPQIKEWPSKLFSV